MTEGHPHRHHVPWSDDAISGPFGQRQRKTQPKGRVCGHPWCDTVLSIYNKGSYCELHRQYDGRRKAPRLRYTQEGKKVCVKCERAYWPTQEFWRADKRASDGLEARCKYCQRKQKRDQYAKRKTPAYARAQKAISEGADG